MKRNFLNNRGVNEKEQIVIKRHENENLWSG